jgi:DDE superfamily endonuclease/Winged helix-turn helix
MSLWTTKLVRHFMYARLGIEYCRERVRQLRHELGFRLRRLRHRHLRAKSQEPAACVADLRALLDDWPDDTELLCVDEATVRRHPTLTAQWCLGDEVADVPTGDDHSKVHSYGAVAPLTGRTHYQLSQELSRGKFAAFLRQLLTRTREKRLLVIHDRAGQHHGTAVDAAVQDAKGRLTLPAQPAYAPELNPEAHTWQGMRRVVTPNHGFNSLSTQIDAIRNCCRYLAGVKDPVQRLCGFKTPESFVASL